MSAPQDTSSFSSAAALRTSVALRRKNSRVSWLWVLMFLYGAGWSISFDVGVRIYAAELVMVLGLMTVRWGNVFGEYKALRDILLAYVLWVAAICLSDIVNATAMNDMARNVSTPLLGGASLVLLVAILSRNPNAAFAFLIGMIIFKAALGDASYGDTFADVALDWAAIQADTNVFKVRIDPFLTPLLILIACYLSRISLYRAAVFLALAAAGYLALDSRSTALVFVLTSLLLLAIGSGFRPRLSHVLSTSLVMIPVLYGFYTLYVEYTLNYNALGHNGKQLLRNENPYNPFALLLQARPEWMIWPVAFSEKPIFGWGSWAIDEYGRFTAMLLANQMATDSQGQALDSLEMGYIPVHSLLGAALVWSGLLGFIAIALLLKAILSLLWQVPAVQRALLPIAAFFGFMILFHFFFSPPQHVRLTFPFAISLLIATTTHAGPFARWRAGGPASSRRISGANR